MRYFFSFMFLFCVVGLVFSQNQSSIKNMSDQQKFMEAYDMLASLAKKNPLMSKLWTDAQMTLLKQAKEVYFALKNEATDDSKAKVQTVAYKKPNPDLSPDPDDDPNTIKQKEFIPYTLELFDEFQKNSQKLVGDERPISIASITTYLSKVMAAKTPLGKELKTKFEAVINDENNTVSKLAVAFRNIVQTYDNNALVAHYKENKAAYLEKKDEKELWPTHLTADIPIDTSFITAAANAYEKENVAPDIFVAKVSLFFLNLQNELAAYRKDSFIVDNKQLLIEWKMLLAQDKGQIFGNLFNAIEALGASASIGQICRVVWEQESANYSAESLRELVKTCKSCSYIKTLDEDLGTLLAQTATAYRYKKGEPKK